MGASCTCCARAVCLLHFGFCSDSKSGWCLFSWWNKTAEAGFVSEGAGGKRGEAQSNGGQAAQERRGKGGCGCRMGAGQPARVLPMRTTSTRSSGGRYRRRHMEVYPVGPSLLGCCGARGTR